MEAMPTDAVLHFLRTPQAHGVAASDLQCSETHMSWLFFTPTQVLKLKKPVRTRYLDHSTVARREFDCREELRLNARLAPGVYQGLTALVRTSAGLRLVAEESASVGETLDWLVRMRRLPESAQLSTRLARREFDALPIDALGGVLARFYLGAPAQRTTASDYLAHLRNEQRINREVLLDARWTLPGAAEALALLDDALAEHAATVGERAQCLVEGHGDLRPEHVYLLDPPVVIDCLEFDPRLRRVDPYDEIAFLGLECEMAGAPWIGPLLQRALARGGVPAPPPDVIETYVAARALLRARLALGHLADGLPRSDAERWRARATRYLERCLRSNATHGSVPC